MADARGAMALRQAAAEPELDAQVAVLAIHLQLYARDLFCCIHQQSVNCCGSLSLRFKDHFPGEPGLAGVY